MVIIWYKFGSVEGCHCKWSGDRMLFNIRERWNFILIDRIPVSTIKILNDDSKRYVTYPCSRSLFGSNDALRIKHPYEEQAPTYRINCEI